MPKRAVRYAVVGLGHIAQVAVLPAFRGARRNSRLAALVSGSAEKRRTLGRRYGVPARSYRDYDALLQDGSVDAVYLALPNHLHADFGIRAARAGVHVLCEKPMAPTQRDCARMIRAAKSNDVRLMIAYRLHFEPANLEALRIANSGRIGELRIFSSTFTMQVKPANIRVKYAEGGGPLFDLGVYCIQAARTLFRADPIEVTALQAAGTDRRFRAVEEMTSAVLRFPGDRLATFTASFGAADVSSYRLVGTRGSVRVEPAYEYQQALELRLTIGERTTRRRFAKRDQFAPQLLHFSDCVLRGRDPEPSGEEGRVDVRIIEALHRAARTRRPVRLAHAERTDRRPSPRQARRIAPVKKPSLVRVQSASR
jgi:predicted dehydrogenase